MRRRSVRARTASPHAMDNDYIIPLIVTLITAMIIGAVYLFVLLLRDVKSEAKVDGEDTP